MPLFFHPSTVFPLQVKYARQQRIKRRVKRDFVDVRDRAGREERGTRGNGGPRTSRSKTPVMFSDPRWQQMWYLVSGPCFRLCPGQVFSLAPWG